MSDDAFDTDLPEAAHDLAVVTKLAGDPGHQDEFLASAVNALGEALNVDAVIALIFNDGLLHNKAHYHVQNIEVQKHQRFDPKKYPTFQHVLQTRQVSNDAVAAQQRDISFLPEHMSQSRLCVPIVTAEKALGILVIETSAVQNFDLSVQHLARAYGYIIGNSLTLSRNIKELEQAQHKLLNHNRVLQADNNEADDAENIVLEDTHHKELKYLIHTAKKSARSEVPILITGETGTGKEVLARQLHRWSDRRNKPFIKINCAALPPNLIESELFGHVKGAFSGAFADRSGRFEIADEGTLLLDEIGDLPLDMQVKLLRVLQEGTYQAVGSDSSKQCDVRILAATNANLLRLIEQGEFREDLYFRLNVINLHLPPLRERQADIPQLVQQILSNIQRRSGRGPWQISPNNLEKLVAYDWPGNIRELVNVLERGRVLAGPNGHIPIKLEQHQSPKSKQRTQQTTWPTLKEHERNFLIDTLKRTRGKIYGKDGAAALLDMPPTTLSSRIQRLDIEPQQYRQ